MRYCEKCGNEIMDEAVVCVHCGCPVYSEQSKATPKKTVKFRPRHIIFIVIGVVLAAALTVGGYFLYNNTRTAGVVNDLAGKVYSYTYTYPSVDGYEYNMFKLKFDKDGVLTYSYYYSNIDASGEYKKTYTVKSKKNMIFLEIGDDDYELQYDKYDKIKAIYNIDDDELYERD